MVKITLISWTGGVLDTLVFANGGEAREKFVEPNGLAVTLNPIDPTARNLYRCGVLVGICEWL